MASIQANVLREILREISRRQMNGPSVDALKRSRQRVQMLALPHPKGTRTVEAGIPGVRAQWHVGSRIDAECRIVYFHGGGYCSGSPQSHRYFTSMLARLTGMPVLSVDYRLTPEHPAPAQQEDGLAAYQWAMANGPERPSKAKKIFIGGDSAGGGLALIVAQTLRDMNALADGAVFMLSPWLDLAVNQDSIRRLSHLDVMVNEANGHLWSSYVRGDTFAVDDPRVSPLFGDFRGLPPLWFAVGGQEILLDDTLQAVEKAREAKVPVTLERNEEMFHVWPVFYAFLPEARVTTERLARWLSLQR